MKLTEALIKECCPHAAVDLKRSVKYINEFFPQYGIKSNREVRYMLAQCFEETDGMHTYREYASGKAYEGRKDLGNLQKGDGTKFAGRGLIMTTGRSNYTRLDAWLKQQGHYRNDSIMLTPELLQEPRYAVLGACFYYNDHIWSGQHLKSIIASGNFENLTKAINGGMNGHETRLLYLGRLNKILGREEIEWPAVAEK